MIEKHEITLMTGHSAVHHLWTLGLARGFTNVIWSRVSPASAGRHMQVSVQDQGIRTVYLPCPMQRGILDA